MPKCKVCRKPSEPFNTLHNYCSIDCQLKWLNTKTGKKTVNKTRRKIHKEKLATVRGFSHWAKVTQTVVNKYVRLRDIDKPCISCGKYDHDLKETPRGKWDAGHYKTVGARSQLRFNTKNINKQCVRCNGYQGGDISGQKTGIVKRFGQARLDWLDGHHESKDYSIEDLAKMRRVFNKKIRMVQKRLP